MPTYPIDPDVRRIARRFAGSSPTFPRLIQAVVRAEGDILKAVRCSVPTCKDREEALEITCRSATHAMSDYLKDLDADGFVEYWAAKWAPKGAGNDPKNLNVHWAPNVQKLWRSLYT